MDAITANLEALLRQDLGDIASEIIVINNDAEIVLRPSRWSKLGRLFRANPRIKLVNARNDWMSLIRWGMVYMARYETVLTLDDDIVFQDNDIVKDMYETLMGLGKYDIVSCWNSIWTQWTESELQYARATFWLPELTELTKTDTCGSGIGMFNKELILDARAQRYLSFREKTPAGDMALGLLSNMLWKGDTYAMPMYGRVAFHDEYTKNALHIRPSAYSTRGKLYKSMLQDGYKPLITREALADDSPEMKLIKRAEPTVYPW
jgi:hypothetical protein